VINEKTFISKIGSFWAEILPGTSTYIPWLNLNKERLFLSLSTEDRHGNRLFIGYLLMELIRTYGLIKSLNEDQIQSASERVFRNFPDGLMKRITEFPLNEKEINCIAELYGRTGTIYRTKKNLVLIPAIDGCGIISFCEADLSYEDTIVEIKTGDVNFSIHEIRQLFVYLSLLDMSKSLPKIKFIELFNPRTGFIFKESIDDVAFGLAGVTADLILNEIQHFIMNPNFMEKW
jgi:hypothetical protein